MNEPVKVVKVVRPPVRRAKVERFAARDMLGQIHALYLLDESLVAFTVARKPAEKMDPDTLPGRPQDLVGQPGVAHTKIVYRKLERVALRTTGDELEIDSVDDGVVVDLASAALAKKAYAAIARRVPALEDRPVPASARDVCLPPVALAGIAAVGSGLLYLAARAAESSDAMPEIHGRGAGLKALVVATGGLLGTTGVIVLFALAMALAAALLASRVRRWPTVRALV